jgi:hypothetical protein
VDEAALARRRQPDGMAAGRVLTLSTAAALMLLGVPAGSLASVDYGPISHKGLRSAGYDLATGWGSPLANVIATLEPAS